jgi:hypothetical protein
MIENIKNMLLEIQRMKDYCMTNYDKGADTMVECWDDEDYENLFYKGELEVADYADPPPVRERVPFARAWDTLKSLIEVYADQRADAKNSAF